MAVRAHNSSFSGVSASCVTSTKRFQSMAPERKADRNNGNDNNAVATCTRVFASARVNPSCKHNISGSDKRSCVCVITPMTSSSMERARFSIPCKSHTTLDASSKCKSSIAQSHSVLLDITQHITTRSSYSRTHVRKRCNNVRSLSSC
jgi:hypothetical protein